MSQSPGTRVLVAVLCVSLSCLGITPAVAGPVSTQQYLELQYGSASSDALDEMLASEAVRTQLVALGVAPADVQARVAALTSEERAQLMSRVQEMPAGGDVLVLLGAVFVVLLVLELVGVIDIFKKI